MSLILKKNLCPLIEKNNMKKPTWLGLSVVQFVI